MIHRFIITHPKRLEVVNACEHFPIPGEIRFETTRDISLEMPWFELALYVDDRHLTPQQLTLIQHACEETTDGQ